MFWQILSSNTALFFFLADAENAFKVRLSIRTALGDKAVSGEPACSFLILFANNASFSCNEPLCVVILNLVWKLI